MKKVLLIMPEFYDYEKEIIEELHKKYAVDFIKMYPVNIFIIILIKALKKIFKNFEVKFYYFYFKFLLKSKYNKKYDYILVINGENIGENLILDLKNNYLNKIGKMILHIWTPISRYPILEKTYKLYDRISSFEKEDCKKYGLIFRTNFYSSILDEIKQNNKKIIYDFIFVGQFRLERYLFIKNFMQLNNNGFYYLYHNFFTFIIFKIIKKEYRNISFKDLKFKQLSRKNMYELMQKSKCILDDTDVNQNGLTQRIFDALYLEKKIITTNKKIKEYEFYNKNNIFVINSQNIIIDRDFFTKEFLKEMDLNSYSLENWCKDVIGE